MTIGGVGPGTAIETADPGTPELSPVSPYSVGGPEEHLWGRKRNKSPIFRAGHWAGGATGRENWPRLLQGKTLFRDNCGSGMISSKPDYF